MRSTFPHRTRAIVISSSLLCLAASLASAAFEGPFEVAQPLVTWEGIFGSTVTFMRYTGSLTPGYAVSLVGVESCVMQESGDPANRNAASLLGICTGYVLAPSESGLFGDTLKVFIDLSGLDSTRSIKGWGWSISGAIDATLESVLLTASRGRRAYDSLAKKSINARFVDVDIRGSGIYRDRGGTFEFDSLGVLPRKNKFW